MNDEKFKSRQTDDNLVSQARMNKKEVGLTFFGLCQANSEGK